MKCINRGFLRWLMVPAFALTLTAPLFADEAAGKAPNAEVDKAAAQVVAEKDSSSLVVARPVAQLSDADAAANGSSAEQSEVKKINFRTALIRAVQYSPDLKAALSRFEQAKWDTEKVKTGHNPRLSFKMNYGLNFPEAIVRYQDLVMPMTPRHALSASIVLEQSISTFGRLHLAEVASKLSEELRREEYRQYYEQELYKTANYYVACLLAEDQLAIAKRQLELREQSLKDAEALFNAGTTAKFDVLRVKTAVSNARQLVIVAENAYNLAVSNLCNRLGYPVDTKLDLDDLEVLDAVPANVSESINLEESYHKALVCRPELHIIDWGKKVAQANYDLAGAANNPNLALQSTLSGSASSSTVGNSTGWSWATGVVFSVPILDGGERAANQGKIKEAIQELEYNLDNAERSIKLDVKNCYLNLSSSWDRINEATAALEQAQEADRVAVVRYEAGLSTSTELLDAHTALGTSEDSLATARYGYFNALVDFVRAISGRYPIDVETIIDPAEYDVKQIDWYDLHKNGDIKFAEVYKDRIQEDSVETTEAEASEGWHKERNEIHTDAYKRSGLIKEKSKRVAGKG